MPKVGVALKNIAAKLGVDTTLPAFAELEKADFEIPEEISNAFQLANVFSVDAAKNNPDLKGYFFAQALDRADERVHSMIDEYGLPEQAKAEILGNKSTYEKIPLLIKHMKATLEAASGATGKEKTELTTKYNELQAQYAKAVGEKETAVAEAVKQKSAEYEERIKNTLIYSKIAGKKLDTSRFPADMMQKLAYDFMVNALKDKGAVLVNDNDQLKIKQLSDPALDYYQNNQPVKFEDFLDEVLANNKLLAVNDQPPAPGDNGRLNYVANPNPGNGRPLNTPINIGAKLDQHLADWEKGTHR